MTVISRSPVALRSLARSARPPGLLVIGFALAPLLGGCVGSGGPDPPTPRDLAELDPVLRAAIESAVSATRADDDFATWHALAELYHANAFHPEAEAAYAVALERSPKDAVAWYERAMNAMSDGRPDDALRHGARAAELDPGYAPGLWRMGEWCFGGGDLETALDWYARAIEADPAFAGGWIGTARVHLQRGRFLEAAQILEARVLGGPSDGYGRQLLARAYEGLGKDQPARMLAAQSRGAQPSVPDPRLAPLWHLKAGRRADIERAIALVKAGKPEAAVLLLEPLLADQPDDVTTLSNYAYTLLEAGRVEEALARAREAVALEPASHAALLIEALALVRIGGGAARPDAIAVLRRALEHNPAAPGIHSRLGLFLQQEGDREAALETFRDGLTYAPEDLSLLRSVAPLERSLGHLAEAEATYLRWSELAPVDPAARIGLGDVRLQRADPAGAEAALAPLVDALDAARGPLDPLVVDARTRLVAALEAQGKDEAAAAHRKRLP